MPEIADPADEQTISTIGEILHTAAQRHPKRDAFVSGDDRLSYQALDSAADGFAATLLDLDVRPGDVVALLLRNGVGLPACYLGASRAAAITSAVNLRLGAAEQAHVIESTRPAVTVVDDDVEPPDGAGTVLRESELASAFSSRLDRERLAEVTATDPVCIVWTSGTTGVPKGAVYDHVCQERISAGMGELSAPGDRRLFVLPMCHVGAMTRVWDDFANGVTNVLAGEPWSADRTLRLVENERITMMTGVPTQWRLLLDHPRFRSVDWSHVRVAGIGAAAIPPELIREMSEALAVPVIARYTSTEAGITTGTLPDDPPEVTATTVGVPSPVVDLEIVDPESGISVTDGEIGEIRCRSRAMFRGYWRDEELTAASFDSDGRLLTGDLGFVGDDGNLRIVGRLKEMYVRGGYNVYPAEVEGVLVTHPQITQAAVVAYPDEVLGERGAAFVVVAEGVERGAPALDEIRAWCAERIADYKAPDRLFPVEALPLTALMKIDKRALEALAKEDT